MTAPLEESVDDFSDQECSKNVAFDTQIIEREPELDEEEEQSDEEFGLDSQEIENHADDASVLEDLQANNTGLFDTVLEKMTYL